MKLLFITYHYLFGKGGGVFASKAYINAFAEYADDMTLLYPMRGSNTPVGINPKVRAIPVWDNRSIFRKGLGLIMGVSNRFCPITNFIDNWDYDIVVFDTSMVTSGLICQFKNRGIKVITIHHNYQFEYFRDNTTGLLKIPTLFWSKRSEKEAVQSSDLNLTLTNSDRLLLLNHYGTGKEKIEILGAFEFEHKVHPVFPEVKEPNFLITGNLGATQTENSLLPWIDDYYPILKSVFPDAILRLAGKSPSDRLIDKARQHGIEIISSPKSMLPILAQAKYYICATSLGGGLKLRVMDGLQTGLPVICHHVSARGYEAFVEKGNVLVYKDQTSFREQLEKLKTFHLRKQEAIVAYEEVFSFESGKKRLNDILTKYNFI